MVAGTPIKTTEQGLSEEQRRIIEILIAECSIKTAVALAVEITGAPKNLLYQAALDYKNAVPAE